MTNGESSPFARCRAVVCDLDGTLYLDSLPLPGAQDFLRAVLESGRKLFYFTNNTSKSRQTYLHKLAALNFPSEDHHLITAADCAENYLRGQQLGPRIYLVGNRDLQSDFKRRGFVCVEPGQARRSPLPDAVVLGFDTEITYEKIRLAYELIIQGVPYVATHGDLLCPLGKGTFIPDVGSFIAMFETATGGRRPTIVGKPYESAVHEICRRAELSPASIAFVGDRLYTDMALAIRFGMVSVLVLSGETTLNMLESSSHQPDFVVEGVTHLISALREFPNPPQ